MPNVKKKVPGDSNSIARPLSILKNDRPITWESSTHENYEVKNQLKPTQKRDMSNEDVYVDMNQNYRIQLEYDSAKTLPKMNARIHRTTNDVNDQKEKCDNLFMMRERTDGYGEMASSSNENNSTLDTNYYTTMDHCDESCQCNSGSQLLQCSFSTTSVPKSVASFSSSSSTSASSQENPLRRGRLKVSSSNKRLRNGRILARKSSLLSFMSRQFLVYRRNCHSVVGDAVLTFMLFLAMLHLSW